MVDEKLHMERRKYLRFNPEILDEKNLSYEGISLLAFVNLDGESGTFKAHLVGLIVDQSHTGAAAVFVNRQGYESFLLKGEKVALKVGNLDPMPALVRWRHDMGDMIIRAGFEFVE